ncbi:hypothetical protein BAUCODRAFT_24433 [Baudoinia panamericana UAMH 10762]|uniref:DUF7605 domain-containing protein n=1 Tax=Baudoinia panamericana (strain UAMH 10762) TaxID=717646 RepID=M2MYN4_BAUPA|nr:uncharacterized protein BAUCODRAFT_24433 [Baudoinia panamericana UAMH 10762]EMC96718.1 hypothetical protein BAUCODRAFT_24433 [Baudoinia panamericana UAMH 10762]
MASDSEGPPDKRRKTGSGDNAINEQRLQLPASSSITGGEDAEVEKNNDGLTNIGLDSFEDHEAAYSETQEPLPRCAAFDLRFTNVKRDLEAFAAEAAQELSKLSCNTPAAARLKAAATSLTSIPKLEKQMIGLLGETGSGKSSLVCSILDQPNIAKALDAGESCTLVPTIYKRAGPQQTRGYSAEIIHLDAAAITELLTGCVEAWEVWTLHGHKSWTKDVEQEHERHAATCLSTFRALFCWDEAQARKVLDGLADPKSSRESQLALYVRNIKEAIYKANHIDDSYAQAYVANTVDELRGQLDALLTETHDFKRPARWPLVKQVIIGIRNGSRILDYFTIADFPDIMDVHQVRVNATLNQIKNCGRLWVVARIGRIKTDTCLSDALQTYGVPFEGNIDVVATKADENIDHVYLPNNLQMTEEEKNTYTKVKADRDTVEFRIKRLQHHRKQLSASQTQRKNQLLADIESLREEQRGLDNRCFSLLVLARNKSVINGIQQDKAKYLPKGKVLHVFPVSNVHYAAAKSGDEVQGGQLIVADTGIPALRNHALHIAAPLDLWANQAYAEDREELMSIVQRPRYIVDTLLKTLVKNLAKQTDHSINDPVYEGLQSFVTVARDVLCDITTWHHSSLAAFLRRNGNYGTRVRPQQSWNERFSAGSSDTLRFEWPSFIREKQHAEEHPLAIALPLGIFEEAIDASVGGIFTKVRAYQEAMWTEFKNILIDATRESPTGYFTKAMRQAYDDCRAITGPGSKARWISELTSHLESPPPNSPFIVLSKRTHLEVGQAASQHISALANQIDGIMQNIVDQTDLMIRRPHFTDFNFSEMAAREKVQKFLLRANPRFAAISRDLAALKKKYDSRGAISSDD